VAQIVVRKLDDDVKRRLRERAQRRGKSMEAEARDILTEAVEAADKPPLRLGSAIAALFADIGLDDDIEEFRGEVRPAEFEG